MGELPSAYSLQTKAATGRAFYCRIMVGASVYYSICYALKDG